VQGDLEVVPKIIVGGHLRYSNQSMGIYFRSTKGKIKFVYLIVNN